MTHRYKSPAQILAIEAEKAAFMASITDKKYKPKIGQYYEQLPKETKEILKTLTSDEARNLRHPWK